nr:MULTISPECIES: hypothetical protein [Protofrankia]
MVERRGVEVLALGGPLDQTPLCVETLPVDRTFVDTPEALGEGPGHLKVVTVDLAGLARTVEVQQTDHGVGRGDRGDHERAGQQPAQHGVDAGIAHRTLDESRASLGHDLGLQRKALDGHRAELVPRRRGARAAGRASRDRCAARDDRAGRSPGGPDTVTDPAEHRAPHTAATQRLDAGAVEQMCRIRHRPQALQPASQGRPTRGSAGQDVAAEVEFEIEGAQQVVADLRIDGARPSAKFGQSPVGCRAQLMQRLDGLALDGPARLWR